MGTNSRGWTTTSHWSVLRPASPRGHAMTLSAGSSCSLASILGTRSSGGTVESRCGRARRSARSANSTTLYCSHGATWTRSSTTRRCRSSSPMFCGSGPSTPSARTGTIPTTSRWTRRTSLPSLGTTGRRAPSAACRPPTTRRASLIGRASTSGSSSRRTTRWAGTGCSRPRTTTCGTETSPTTPTW